MKKLLLVLLFMCTVITAGCIAIYAVPSAEKQAYVAAGTIFGTNMYHCTATENRARCVKVQEE
jgi:uncharacterized protein YceK